MVRFCGFGHVRVYVGFCLFECWRVIVWFCVRVICVCGFVCVCVWVGGCLGIGWYFCARAYFCVKVFVHEGVGESALVRETVGWVTSYSLWLPGRVEDTLARGFSWSCWRERRTP